VEGKPITHEQLYQALESQDNGQAGKQALESLIVRQLIREEANKRGIKADTKELQSRIDGLKDYILAGTGKGYAAWLGDTGQTEQDVADRVTMQVLTARLVLTDQDRKQFFEANKEKLKDVPHNNESAIYRQIVVATKSDADAIHSELMKTAGGKPVSDEQFAKVADEKSIDPMTRGRGGMRGWWIKGKGSGMGEKPDAQLEKALFSLKAGELSQPLPYIRPTPPAPKGQTAPPQPEQWQIVMVDKHITPHPIALEENQDVIEDWMLNDPRYQYQVQQFFENLRSKAKIEVVSPRYKSVQEEYQKRNEMRQKMQQQAPAMGMPQAPGGAAPQLPAGAQPGAGGAAKPSGR
jgi:parvulin-like peptidyl-prolyl isomerase